jgi:myosin heavy subunit
MDKKNEKLPPHVYGISSTAFHSLPENQTIIVSGESGAGKTETVKLILQYLAYTSSSLKKKDNVFSSVLSSNPLLESFGNAKTCRNDNSSRFGKKTLNLYFEWDINF